MKILVQSVKHFLAPTKIYAKPVLADVKAVDVHGMAHVTGGGFYENLPRMMPEGLQLKLI